MRLSMIIRWNEWGWVWEGKRTLLLDLRSGSEDAVAVFVGAHGLLPVPSR